MTEYIGNVRGMVVVLMAAAILIFGRVHLPLLMPEEDRNASVAREMASSGSWLVPMLEGQPYLDKPPLLYWLVIVSEGLLSESSGSARFVTASAAWLTILVTYHWGRAIDGPEAGILAAGVLTLTGDFVYRGPMLTMNGLLGLFVTCALAAGHTSLVREVRPGRLWGSAALSIALGIMVKGPIALVLAIPPLAVVRYRDPTLRRAGIRDWLMLLSLTFVLAAPWFIALAIHDPTFVEYFFWRHNLLRFFQPFDHAKPVWAYLPQVALGWLPWLAVLFWAVVKCRRFPKAAWVGLLAAGWGLLFFSLAGSKRPAYLVPIEPAFALATGVLIANSTRELEASKGLLAFRRLTFLAGVTALVLAAGVFVWLPYHSDRFGRQVTSSTASFETTVGAK